MQSLTKINMVTVKDYDHMTTMNENMKMDETNKSIVKFSLNLRTPLCTSTLTFFFFLY